MLYEMRCDLVQFKKREKHPWKSVILVACNVTKSNTPKWVFFAFFKLYKWYQISQHITCIYNFKWYEKGVFTFLRYAV